MKVGRQVAASVSLSVVFFVGPALACTCSSASPNDDKARRSRYALTFWGKAQSRECAEPAPAKNIALGQPACLEYRSSFVAYAVWKGRVARAVTVQPGRGSCDAGFEPGESYLVFAEPVNADGSIVATTLCTGSHKSSLEEARRTLGKPRKSH